jgi:hypothetical protein
LSNEELLRELRDQYRSSWWYTCPDVDGLAQRAAEKGCLQWAFDAAEARGWAAMGSSSNSSRATIVYGPEGRAEDRDAFVQLLRDELLKALADC